MSKLQTIILDVDKIFILELFRKKNKKIFFCKSEKTNITVFVILFVFIDLEKKIFLFFFRKSSKMNTIACDIQKLCIHFYNFLKKNLFVLFSEIWKNESRFFRLVEYIVFIFGNFRKKKQNDFFSENQKNECDVFVKYDPYSFTSISQIWRTCFFPTY